jgi:hypothetical protein
MSHAPSPFCSGYFSRSLVIYGQAGLDLAPPIYASHQARMAGLHLHTQLSLVELGSCGLFAQPPLNHDPFNLCSQVAGITGVSPAPSQTIILKNLKMPKPFSS